MVPTMVAAAVAMVVVVTTIATVMVMVLVVEMSNLIFSTFPKTIFFLGIKDSEGGGIKKRENCTLPLEL